MKSKTEQKLSIFETFKTKTTQLTGEATRQRLIIAHLALSQNTASKTRTAISQNIAKKNGIAWKNIYSGVFRDLDEVLIPLRLVEEAGRLPLKRGPKALQETGIPYYELTEGGLIIALSLNEIEEREKILEAFFDKSKSVEKGLREILRKLAKIAPRFSYSIFEKYSKAYTQGKIKDLLPFNISNLKKITDDSLGIQLELIEALSKVSNSEKEKINQFLKSIS